MRLLLAPVALALIACSSQQAAEAPPPAPAGASTEVTDTARPADTAPSVDSARSTGTADTAVRSVYTSLAEADCRLVERDEETGGTVHRCPGVAGYALKVSDWDARMSVTVVAPDGSEHPLKYTSVITHNFSMLGPRAEWRVSGAEGRPQALIVRVNANEDNMNPERTTSYLAVARVTPQGSCVTERIRPVADANILARQAADRAAGRPCLEKVPS